VITIAREARLRGGGRVSGVCDDQTRSGQQARREGPRERLGDACRLRGCGIQEQQCERLVGVQDRDGAAPGVERDRTEPHGSVAQRCAGLQRIETEAPRVRLYRTAGALGRHAHFEQRRRCASPQGGHRGGARKQNVRVGV